MILIAQEVNSKVYCCLLNRINARKSGCQQQKAASTWLLLFPQQPWQCWICTDLPKILNGTGKFQKNTFVSHQIPQIGAKPDFWEGFAAHPSLLAHCGMAAAAPWPGHPSVTANTKSATASGFHSQGVMGSSSLWRKGQTFPGLDWSSVRGSCVCCPAPTWAVIFPSVGQWPNPSGNNSEVTFTPG